MMCAKSIRIVNMSKHRINLAWNPVKTYVILYPIKFVN